MKLHRSTRQDSFTLVRPTCNTWTGNKDPMFGDVEANDKYSSDRFWKIWRPLLLPMKLTMAWPYNTTGEFVTANRCRRFVTVLVTTLYWFQLLGFHVGVAFLLLNGLFATLLLALSTAAFIFQNTVNLTILLVSRKKLGILLANWYRHCQKSPMAERNTAKYCKIMGVILTATVFGHGGLLGANSLEALQSFLKLPPFSVPARVIFIIVSCLLHIIYLTHFLSMIYLFLVFIKTLINEFMEVSKTMAEDKQLKHNVGIHRKSHHTLCKTVSELDVLFGPVISCFLLIAVTTSLLLLQGASDSYFASLGAWARLVFLSTVTIILINLFTFIYFCGKLTEKAGDPLEILHDLQMQSLDEEQRYEVLVFTQRLTGPAVGITACKFFLLDRNLILTIIGVLFTYYVLLVQFKPEYNELLKEQDGVVISNSTMLTMLTTTIC